MPNPSLAALPEPLTVRKRPDLSANRQRYQGTGYWVVKEPVGLQYFRFHDEEYFILNMLDGHVSLQQIKDGFEQRFAPQKITFGDLQQFIGMLHRSGLVISNSPGQGKALARAGPQEEEQGDDGQVRERVRAALSRFRPRTDSQRYPPLVRLAVHRPGVDLLRADCCIASLLLASQYETVYARLPTFQQFFAADRWLILAVTMAIVKVLHEFGHGLSCKKFGGECHEIGFMLLVFTPCLYCNVSDSWMLPNKWKRVWIGAAGIYVEMILASIAAFIWWFTEQGTTINDLCLNMMFLNVVSTVLVNGNPLLRFDGYYILMDVLEIPNLRQKSTEVLKRWFQETCLGLELQDDPVPADSRSIHVRPVHDRQCDLSLGGRFLHLLVRDQSARAVRFAGDRADGCRRRICSGLVAQPVIQTWKFCRTPGRLSKVKRTPLLITLGIVAAVIAAVCYIPLPHHIDCAFEIRPSEAGAVYAGTPGRIEWTVIRKHRVTPSRSTTRLSN